MRQNRQMDNPEKMVAPTRLKATAGILFICAVTLGIWNEAPGQQKTPAKPAPVKAVPKDVMLMIVRAEDERRYDNDLGALLFDKDMRVRRRAALAAGRIGD